MGMDSHIDLNEQQNAIELLPRLVVRGDSADNAETEPDLRDETSGRSHN
jgi:hypothetical protein